MDTPLQKLTVIAPALLQGALTDCLDSLTPELPGYTSQTGEGRGPLIELKTPAERVRGAARIVSFTMIMPAEQVASVLDAIRETCPAPHISFWTEPVLDFGRLK